MRLLHYLHDFRTMPFFVVFSMAVGVGISDHSSKPVDRFLDQSFDFVVTVCDQARESCPVFPGASDQRHWSFSDPSAARGSEEERLEVFRRVRDEIAARVEQFLTAATEGKGGRLP